jgi:hypothetical protein
MIKARSVVPPQSSFVKLLKRYRICCIIRVESDIANTKDFVCEFLIFVRGFDENVDSSISLNWDLIFACPHVLTRASSFKVDKMSSRS